MDISDRYLYVLLSYMFWYFRFVDREYFVTKLFPIFLIRTSRTVYESEMTYVISNSLPFQMKLFRFQGYLAISKI